MRYEVLPDDDSNNGARSGGHLSSSAPRTPVVMNGANLPLLSSSSPVSPSSTAVGRIRISSALLGLLGVLTGAVLMFLVAALRHHIIHGGGTHVINPHPGYSAIPASLESLERRALWLSGRTLAPLHILRARLQKAESLVKEQNSRWQDGNCSIGNPALDAFAGITRYTNSTLATSAAAARFLGSDFATEFSPNDEETEDLRADNFGFDNKGSILLPGSPTQAEVSSVLSGNNNNNNEEKDLPPPAVLANISLRKLRTADPKRTPSRDDDPSDSLESDESLESDDSLESGSLELDVLTPESSTFIASRSKSPYRSLLSSARASLWSYLFPAGLFNRRHVDGSLRLTGVANESSLFFFSNNTMLPGMEGVEDTEAVCLKGFTAYSPGSCLGAPYLYVSYHGGRTEGRARAVCKFTRDGCAMGVALMPSSLHALQHPRGLMIHGNYLFAAESDRDNSAILRYSHCNPALGNRRELLEVLVGGKEGDPDAGLVHPYGFAKDDNGWLYVSAQDTFVVLRYDALTGEAAPLPPALQHVVLNDTSIEELIAIEDEEALEARDEKRERIRQRVMRKYRLRLSGHAYENFYNGTFVDLGTDGVRGIAVDGQGLLYVADKAKGLLVFDREGYSLGQMPIGVRNPISVHYCGDRNSIWVGSADSMALMEYDTVTWELIQSIQHREMLHPAGFITHGDSLYVISQRSNKLLRFSMITGLLEDVVLEGLPDAGERLIISPC